MTSDQNDQNEEREDLEKETLKDLEAKDSDDVKGGTTPPTHAGCVPDSKLRTVDPQLTT